MLRTLLLPVFLLASFIPARAQWTLSNAGINTFYDLTCVHFPTASVGYAGGTYAFYKTTNGGGNWTDVLAAIPSAYRSPKDVYFQNKDTGFICGWGSLNGNNSPIQGYILKTTNGGTSWTPVKTGTPGPIYSVRFTDAANGYAAGGSSDGAANLYNTTDGGNTWNLVSSFPGFNIDIFSMSVAPNGTVYMCGMLKKSSFDFREILFRKPAASSTIDTFTFETPMFCTMYRQIQTLSNNETYVVGNKCFNKTTNGGTTWQPVDLNNATSSASFETLHFTSSQNGFAAGNYGDVYQTTNAGASWTKVTLPSAPHFTDFYFLNANTGFLVGYAGTVYKYAGSASGVSSAQQATPVCYPNPARDRVVFTNVQQPYLVSVMTMSGQAVLSVTLTPANAALDVSALPAGVYTLQLRSTGADAAVSVQKLVITR